MLSLYYFSLHLLPQVATHTVNTLGTSEGQAATQSSSEPPHALDPPDRLEAFTPAPPRAYTIAAVVLMVLSSSILRLLVCLVVVSSSDEDGSGHRS